MPFPQKRNAAEIGVYHELFHRKVKVRPDYIGGDVELDEKSRFNYFNYAAFARPREGQLGNVGRNTLRGPGINN